MSRKRKGKYQPLQSKRKKGRQRPEAIVSRQETAPRLEEAVVAISAVDVKPAATQVAAVVKAPEMVAELRRIGILAVVVLATLIILALVLG
jgi:hypothetical protein